jgi:hypothetical protein
MVHTNCRNPIRTVNSKPKIGVPWSSWLHDSEIFVLSPWQVFFWPKCFARLSQTEKRNGAQLSVKQSDERDLCDSQAALVMTFKDRSSLMQKNTKCPTQESRVTGCQNGAEVNIAYENR